MSKITKIKGFADLFPPESDVFTRMESVARQVFGRYGFVELRTPILERTDLFCRSIGTETDVVQKEMYTFPDRKDRSLTMRPEATAGVMRAYIESGRHTQEPVSKLFTSGPMFRYERPQKGRMRQFHQINCEVLGPVEPHADAELVLMLMRFLTELGLTGLSLQINSLGCKECRPLYRKALSDFLASIDNAALCEDCRRRMETNPLRVLDCKVPGCRELTANAPTILEHNCPECRTHFDAVLRILDSRNVPYVLNDRLVRGLDYYNRTTFEVVSDSIGSQGSVAGGGRYDGLISQLGGPDVPGVGFACGMERLALMMPGADAPRPHFHVAVLDPAAQDAALLLAEDLRAQGLTGSVGFGAGSIKSRMRLAGKSGARACLILGGDELAAGTVVVKDMDSGEQETIGRDAVAARLLAAGA
ncbi:histidine--tRNA ligase [Nitratidesulfovibrio vulgaris]|uniref:Histidine--tRNA ligase n=1 Tax=Nitratidesulfovibrio vulgaris (strain ATCC 29579 / DSM 644 / CCUG 34227 / NCIMB 8303 / VKM B-1760 / Hildenborough) TaxID=882 RepID=SYH_NITV2|nr:histidine--tRNA ligase [Nitratidesulfovibrio vulgaris]P62379.1 RecName: Full=Histidine--tRNA ligase; AltName: Full=Histidyl-tRNA synthetase; Short=HisRS [Nitratidesulfovibrio vulgaris str. Hildenborough]AAS97837.1 histidyl-tRNA synthetase [Nitratidesulfovibrio vulgaris str. Hildenborough]ADP85182.1 histidyl-tRNA synthetase [Nitratidesulfovibrio vulgaris RCH1]